MTPPTPRPRHGDARWRDVAVLMYSADFDHDRMCEAEQLGVRDYVVKGTMRWTEFAEILNRYATFAQSRRRCDTLGRPAPPPPPPRCRGGLIA